MGRLLPWIGVVLVTATLAAASAAQDEPPGPAFGSTYRYQFTPDFGRSIRFCTSRLTSLPNGNPSVHSLFFNRLDNVFLAALDTPTDRFQAPPGWTWRPDLDGNAWLASSPNAMPLDQELCFVLPVTRPVGLGDVARIVAEAQNRDDLYYFTSQQVVPKAKRGDLPLVYRLPQQNVTGFFTSPSSACGLVRQFNTGLRLSAENNVGKIVQPDTGDTVQGAMNPKTYTFKFVGPTEVYEGGIKGLNLWASYGYTRIFGSQPCTAGYLVRLALNKRARVVPACKHPTIVAPARVTVRSNRWVRFNVFATCARRRVAGLKLTISARANGNVTRIGSVTTRARPLPVNVRLSEGAHGINGFVLRTPPQFGLEPWSAVVNLFFPPRR